MGAAVGFGEDLSLVGTDGTRNAATAYSGTFYGSYHPTSQTYLDAVAGFASLANAERRNAASIGELESGQRSGQEFFGSLTAAFVAKHGPFTLSPYARLDGLTGMLNPFTESGGFGAAAFQKQSLQSLEGTLGGRANLHLTSGTFVFEPQGRVEFGREFDDQGTFALQYADWLTGPTYTGAADALARNRLLFGLGTDVSVRNLRFSIEYTYNADGAMTKTNAFVGKLIWNP